MDNNFFFFFKIPDTVHFATAICQPQEFLRHRHVFFGEQLLCMVTLMLDWVGLAVSGLSLTLLNIDKLIYFRWPFTYDRLLSNLKASLICAGIWVVCLVYVIYVWGKVRQQFIYTVVI